MSFGEQLANIKKLLHPPISLEDGQIFVQPIPREEMIAQQPLVLNKESDPAQSNKQEAPSFPSEDAVSSAQQPESTESTRGNRFEEQYGGIDQEDEQKDVKGKGSAKGREKRNDMSATQPKYQKPQEKKKIQPLSGATKIPVTVIPVSMSGVPAQENAEKSPVSEVSIPAQEKDDVPERGAEFDHFVSNPEGQRISEDLKNIIIQEWNIFEASVDEESAKQRVAFSPGEKAHLWNTVFLSGIEETITRYLQRNASVETEEEAGKIFKTLIQILENEDRIKQEKI